jgi:putative endonuclease
VADPRSARERATRGEELAAEQLRRAGLEILDRNWRAGRYEIDIVAREGSVIAFVEVKARSDGPQAPLEALDRRKRARVRRAAEAWIRAHPGVGREFRFDAVGVGVGRDGRARLEHVRGAFQGEDT